MPVLRVEDPDTGQVVDVPWEGEGVPDAETIRAAREKALATAPKPAAVRLIDMFRSVGAEAESFRQQHPAFGGELWAAKKTAEFAGQQLAKLRRPIDRGIGYTLKAAAERSQAALADPAKRAALEARYPGEASAQEAANQRRLAAAARMIADQGTLGSEFRAATSGPGGPATKSQAVSDVALGMGVDFVSDPSNLAIGGLSKLGRLGAQLQYVLGAALTGTAGLGAAQKAKEVAVLASEGKLNSPTAAAAATEGVLSALMAGFGARGVMKGWSRDQVLGEIERAQKEADMLAAEGVQATPPEVAGAVGFLKPLLQRHAKLRTEFNKNVKGMHKRQIDALRKAMADLEANPTDEQAAKVYESLRGQAEAPNDPTVLAPAVPRLKIADITQGEPMPDNLTLEDGIMPGEHFDLSGRPVLPRGYSVRPRVDGGRTHYDVVDPQGEVVDTSSKVSGNFGANELAWIDFLDRRSVESTGGYSIQSEDRAVQAALTRLRGEAEAPVLEGEKPPASPAEPATVAAAAPSPTSGGNRHPIPDSAVASLRSWIGQHAQRDPFTALHAQEGLDRLLGLGDQRIPLQGSERSALRKVFGKDAHNIFREYDASVAAERTPLQKGRDLVLDLLFNSSRALQSSEIGPSSATLRQGGPVAIYQTLTHPIKTARDVLDSARSFFNPQVYRGIQKDMANSSYIYRPAAPGKPPVKVDLTRLMDEFGVERATREMGPDQANETLNDYFSQGDVIQRAPVVGEVVKGANRAYAAILDPFRRSTFAAMDELMRDAGMTPETHPSDWQMAGAATNQLTGLAKLPKIPLPGGKSLDLNVGSGNQLVRMFYYAPRFFYSRLFNLADTVTAGVRFQNSKSLHDFFTKLEPVHPVRKQYLKIMGSYAAFWGTILYAASHLPGVAVETDPRSSDVVKMKVGDTRFDVWSGLQQPLRFFSQMASGQRKSNESGKVSPIVGSPGNYARRLATELSTGEAAPPDKTGPFTSDAEDVTGTFLESKESPAVSYFRDIQRGGKDVFGREADLNPLTRFLPFGMRDVSEVAKSNPALVPAVAVAASLGIGTQTYQPRKPAGVGEAETKVKALRATQDEPKPEPAPEEKLAKRVKKGARAEYELKIREAMARGDDLAALEAIEEADFAGFRFRELEKKIMGYDTPEDEE